MENKFENSCDEFVSDSEVPTFVGVPRFTSVPSEAFYLDCLSVNDKSKAIRGMYYREILDGNPRVPKFYYKVFQQCSALWLRRIGSILHNWTEERMSNVTLQSKHEDTIDKAISSIGKITMSDAAKRIGNFFGFFDTPMIPTICQYPNAPVDLPLEGRSFATMTGDVGQLSNFYGDKINPMDILGRCKVYSRVTTMQWKTSDTQTSILSPFGSIQNIEPKSIPVTPSICRIQDLGTRLVGQETPLSFFAKYFAWWRGSLKFKFEVVNSRFHQGQLFIAYVPFNSIQGTSYDMSSSVVLYANARNCMCASIDLSVNNCTEMVIPYICPFDYTSTGFNSNGAQRNYWAAANKANIGAIFVYVQNVLDAASTVSNTVDINVYIAAGDDFEFKVVYPAEAYLSYTDGRYQSGEVIDATLPVPVNSASNDVPLDEALHNSSGIMSADTSNIMSREYIVKQFSWTTTQTRGSIVDSMELPSSYFSVGIAPSGLKTYHYLLKTDFDVRVRINPTPFHIGILICFWSPAESFDGTTTAVESVTQFPHAFINAGVERECIVRVPYSQISKLQEISATRFGFFYVMAWNALSVATGQSTSLQGTIWVRAVNPYVAVKTSISVQSGELSDTALGGATSQVVGVDARTNTTGYIKTNHTLMEALLRRPDYVGGITHTVTESTLVGDISPLALVGNICGARHLALLRTATYWSGNNKLIIVSPVNKTQGFVLCAWPQFSAYTGTFADVSPNPVFAIGNMPIRGGQFIDMSTSPIHTFEMPYYNITPFASTLEPTPVPYVSNNGRVNFGLIAETNAFATTFSVNIIFLHAVGDQFQMYLCRNMPITTFLNVDPMHIQSDTPTAFVPAPSLALSGDVELNPGPGVLSKDFKGTCTLGTVQSFSSSLSDMWKGVLDKMRMLKDMVSNGIKGAGTIAKVCVFAGKTCETYGDVFKRLVFCIDVLSDFVFHVVSIIAAVYSRSEAAIAICIAGATKWLAKLLFPIELNRGDVQGGVASVRNGVVQSGESLDVFDSLRDMTSADTTVYKIASMILRWMKYDDRDFRSVCKVRQVLAHRKGKDNSIVVAIETVIMYFLNGSGTRTAVVDDIASRANVLRDEYKNVKDGTLEQLTSIYDRMLDCQEELVVASPLFHGAFVHIPNKLRDDINECKKRIEEKKDLAGKLEPIFTWLHGESGVGKTTLLKLLAIMCQLAVGLKPTGFYAWPVDKEAKYADGYEGQDVVIMDEALSSTDSNGPITMVRLFNTENMPVNQAAISDKGRKFSSRIILATSNLRTLEPCAKEMTNINALIRRVAFPLTIKPAAEFTLKGRMDIAKFTKMQEDITLRFADQSERLVHLIDLLDRVYVVKKFRFGTGPDEDLKYSWKMYFEDFRELWKLRNEVHQQSMGIYARLMTGSTQAGNFVEDLRAIMDNKCGDSSSSDIENYTDEDIDDFVEASVANDESINCKAYLIPRLKPLNNDDAEYNARCILRDEYQRRMRGNDSRLLVDIKDYKALIRYHSSVKSDLKIEDAFQTGVIKTGTARPLLCAFYTAARLHRFEGLLAVCKKVGAVLLGAAAVGVVIMLIKYLTSTMVDMAKAVVQTGYDSAIVKLGIRKAPKINRSFAGFVQNGSEDVTSCIKRNMRTVFYRTLRRSDGTVSDVPVRVFVSSLAVDSNRLLLPTHFIKLYKLDCSDGLIVTPMRIESFTYLDKTDENALSQPIDVSDFVAFKKDGRELDIGYVYTSALTHCRNITSQFVSVAEYNKFVESGQKPIVTLLGRKGTMVQTEDSRFRYQEAARSNHLCKYEIGGKDNYVSVCWVEPLDGYTKSGDCGRPYVLPGHRRCQIFGLHSLIENTSIRGGVTEITREMVESIPVKKPHLEYDVDVVLGEPQQGNSFWKANIDNYGAMMVNGHLLSKNHVAKTSLIPMRRNGKTFDVLRADCDMLPAAQKPVGGLHPLYSNAQKYDTDALLVPKGSIYRYCLEYYCNTRVVDLQEGRVLTDYEALNGYSENGIEVFTRMQRKTSCGYWTIFGWKDGKVEFIDSITNPDGKDIYKWSELALTRKTGLDNKPFVEHLVDVETKLRHGNVPFLPWVVSTKDEIRPRTKVEQCKTRVFEMPCLEFNFLFRKYFGHFASEVKKKYGTYHHHGIGADKPTVWKRYWCELNAVGVNGFDVDYKNYDGSIPRSCFDFFLDVTDHFYRKCSNEDRVARHALIAAMRDAWLIVGSDLVHTDHGNKSGNPLTDVFNSISNIYIVYSAFVYAQHLVGKEYDLTELDRCVRFITYGDDIIFGVADLILPWFNRLVFAEYASALGMSVTGASKDEELIPFQPLRELTFLSSSFVEYEDTVLCPMPIRSIYKEMLWRPRALDEDETDFQLRVSRTCEFMAEHGRAALEQYQRKLQQYEVPMRYFVLGRAWNGVPILNFDDFIENKRVVQDAEIDRCRRSGVAKEGQC